MGINRPQPRQTPRLIALTCLCLFVCTNLGLLAPTARAQPKFEEFETRYYVIHTNLSRDEATEYGRHMDLIFAEYNHALRSLRGQARRKQQMYLLRTREDYVATLAKFGIDGAGSGGMFWYRGSETGLATYVEDRDRGEVLSVLQHEGFHQFAFIKTRGNLPIWVNEGLAEYFGDAIIVAGKVKHGIVNAQRLQRVRDAVDNDRAIPFGQMLTIESDQWFANMRGGSAWGSLQYDQAWSICHFLIHDSKKIQAGFERYLGLLSGNRNPRQAFAEAFGSNETEPFERRYRKFLAELKPDDYSAALTRMRFLATGLRYLQREGEPAPADLDALKKALRDRSFALTHRSHGQETVYDSADDTMYVYLDRKGAEFPFELTSAKEEDAPPQIFAGQLRPPARIVWQTDEESGDLRSDVAFGR